MFPRSGRPPSLNDPQKQQLKQILLDGAIAAGYPAERWTSKIVAHLIKKKFGVALAPRSVRDLLPTLGLSPQMPVVKSHKYDEIAAMKWANHTWQRLKKSKRTRHSSDILGSATVLTRVESGGTMLAVHKECCYGKLRTNG